MIGKTNASSGSMQLCQGETGSLVLPTSTSFDVSVNGIFQEEYNKNSITVHLPSEECYLLINCWGGTSGKIYFDYGNTFFDFWNVFLFQSGGITTSDQLNAQGNHIGFQELALSYKSDDWVAKVYWQSIFEDMSAAFIGFGMNSADGLWGINIQQSQWPYINELTYEFLNTTSQSGPMHDKDGLVFAGRDTYYHNSAYPHGWSYFGSIIGNPYIQVNNSRVRAHFVGLGGDIYGYNYRLMASHVNNYGTYQQPSYSTSTALMLEVSKYIEKAWGLEFSVALAGDIGTQYGNQFGAMLTIRKRGLITQW